MFDAPSPRLIPRPAFALLAVLLLAPAAWAVEVEVPSTMVEATGRATIYHEDLSSARDRAIRAAQIRALERYAGLRIEASTLIQKGELIDRMVRAYTQGYVTGSKVLSEERDGKEMVVRLQVEVAPEPVAESFRRTMSATTTLLLVKESNLDQGLRGHILPAILADPFFGSGLVVPPKERLERLAGQVGDRYYERPDPETTQELGLRWLAGLVVVVSAETREMESGVESIGYEVDAGVTRPFVEASGNLTVLDARTGKTLTTRRFDDVRGSDSTSVERAGREALRALAEQMKDFVVESLTRHVDTLGFPLRVKVRGNAAADGARGVARLLEDVRWVESVRLVKEDAQKQRTVLELRCRENPLYVVEELRGVPELEILRFEAGLGEVEVQ